VNVGLFRENPASHGPPAERALLVRAAPAAWPASLVNSGQGGEQCPRHEVPEAIGVGAKSLPGAIPGGMSRLGDPRPLTLRTFGGLSSIERKRSIAAAVPAHGLRWSGMFGRSIVVLVETSICRSRGSARGHETPAKAVRNKGLVEVFEHR
jgi:hypothetical protein